MATYVNDLRLTELATGEGSGTWGTTTNTNLELIANSTGLGSEAIANASTHTITMADGAADEFRSLFLRLTGGGQACTVTLAPNTLSHTWIMRNETAAALTLTQGSGANVVIAAGQTKIVATDGAGSGAVVYELDDIELAGNLAVGADATVGDDLTLNSDASVLGFGADTDTTLTHVADTGLLLNSTRQLQFGDSGTYIHQSADGVLDLVSDTEIEINATTIDINGNADISGTIAAGGVVTANAGVVVDNITIDGTEIDLSSGDLTLDVAGDIILDADGADIKLLNGGTHWGSIYTNATPANLYIQSMISDGDIYLSGSDGGSNINALVLDMSAAGAATFNSTVTASGTSVFASLDISGDIDVDGTTNLDVVDIDGAVDMASTLTVGSHLSVTNGASSLTRTHATTNASLQILDLKATSSGDMADGFGPSIHFSASDTGATSDQVAEINAVRAGSDTVFNLEFQTADTTRLTLGASAATFVPQITANAGVVVDNITIDGTEIDLSSGDLTLDVAGDIILDADGAQIRLKDAGTEFGVFSHESPNLIIKPQVQDGDLVIKGDDGGNTITALTLDMSDSGKATFNNGASFSHDVTIDADGRALRIGAGQDLALFHDGTDSTIREGTGDLILSNIAADKDIVFKGNDGGSTITSLTLDMSAAGAATFNSSVTTGGEVSIAPSSGTAKLRLTSQGTGSEVFTVNGQIPGVANGGFAIRNETDSRNDFTIDAAGAATFNSSVTAVGATFNGSVAISNSSGDTLTLTKSTTEPSFRIEGDTDKDFVITVSGELLTFTQNDGATDILTLDHDTKAATFGGAVTANAGISVDNITIDGNEIDVSSGNLTLDVAGGIVLDGGSNDLTLNNSGTTFAYLSNNSGSLQIYTPQQDKDILFKGNDGGSAITALTLICQTQVRLRLILV
jgi:hypothetical protein